jgi:hypothetical protein
MHDAALIASRESEASIFLAAHDLDDDIIAGGAEEPRAPWPTQRWPSTPRAIA